jgi:hypothetical protein
LIRNGVGSKDLADLIRTINRALLELQERRYESNDG